MNETVLLCTGMAYKISSCPRDSKIDGIDNVNNKISLSIFGAGQTARFALFKIVSFSKTANCAFCEKFLMEVFYSQTDCFHFHESKHTTKQAQFPAPPPAAE
jgi:hypothetical protein